MEADWDLLAVVRGCTSTTTTATTGGALQVTDLHQHPPPPPAAAAATLPRITAEAAFGGFFSSGCEDLGDLYKPFFPNLKCSPISSTLAGRGFIREQRPHPQQQLQHPQQIVFQQHPQQQVKESQVIFGSSASSVAPPCTAAASIISVGSIFTSQSQRTSVLCSPTTSTAATTSQTQQRAKKRKNLQKRVCHVPAEGLSSDMWAWRKYGQKPIKGSPYPRGYYRCSSSKGCPARKQVERNRSNPKMFIVTYTAEHNHPMPTHRNSLAGSTRQKPGSASDEATAAATAASPSTNSTGNDHPSSPTASPSSAMTEKGEVKTEYEEDMAKDESSGNEMEFPEMVMNDDFFVGFEELDDMDTGDVFLDQIQGRMEYPWLSNSSSSSSTAAAAGGS